MWDKDISDSVITGIAVPRDNLARGEQIPAHMFEVVVAGERYRAAALEQVLVYGRKVKDVAAEYTTIGETETALHRACEKFRKLAHEKFGKDLWNDRLGTNDEQFDESKKIQPAAMLDTNLHKLQRKEDPLWRE